jgi:heme exporter protein C
MRRLLPWLLWLWISAVIAGAFFYAPLAMGFIGQSSRILFFHVPMAWVSFVAFIASGVWSALFLFRGRRPKDDRAAAAAVELGLIFGVLATVSGALWARIMWGAYWNWDPRQTSILVALLFYGAYLALRSSIEDRDTRARLSAAYAVLGLYFILPRIMPFSLHPQSVVNAQGKVEMESRMLQVLLAGSLAFTALFFWIHNLQCRIQALADRKSAPMD